jgi:nonsense-mediated mRNA decay protein 3
LKKLEGVEQSSLSKKTDLSKDELDYEHFLDDLEEDKEMRSQINIYKGLDQQSPANTEKFCGSEFIPSIPIDEMLDDLSVQSEVKEDFQTFSSNEARQTQAWELEEL